MTRARALKQIIRARAAKTGERYTTARRQVLAQMQLVEKPVNKPPAVPAPAATRTAATKGAISDAAVIKKTGKDLAYWYDVLDRFGAVEKGHTAAARHL